MAKTKKKNPQTNFAKTKEGFKKWTAFYRANPHRFANDYLGVKLFLYQKLLLWAMNKYSFFMYIAARGQGKSYIIAIYCVIRAILYPSSNIVLASGTKGQARLIITEKIFALKNNSKNVDREIKEFKTSANECYVVFWNGSKITAVTSGDSARGYRANILIVDEFRLITKETIDQILRPFLNVNRTPPYLQNPKYKHLTEENKEIYISSAWYKNHWIWESFKSYLNGMLSGKDYFVAVLPWQLSVFHNLLSRKRVEQQQTEADFDQMSWDMEYEALFVGENENAYFKLDDIQKCRTLPKPFYPPTLLEWLDNRDKKKKLTNMPKQSGEIRLVGMDVALMGSSKAVKNDTTQFTLMRLLPQGDEYRRDVVYMEKMEGEHSEIQAIRLKQLYYDFEADYVALDTNGNGMSVSDDLMRIIYDRDRDIEYPAWTVINDEMMDDRKIDKNAIPVIYSIKGNNEINHKVATGLRSAFEKRKIRLLINDIEAREEMIEKKGYLKKTTEEQVYLMKPFAQATALTNELVNLVYKVSSGYIKIEEVGTTTKDRYSSVGYANYVATLLEQDLIRANKNDDILSYVLF
ncbi:terminase family protein [Bacillus spizizenii]|uniref:terminase large subunit domain-containing protein n=1 Tax=Bacillus subtilis TaxID=1423 RepID=UPI002282353E|nr:terminase large subunit [Bacillus subtilis]MCY9056071.1 terminase family protein [Bacillus spizizenii]MCY9124879.1 terminase family protein [Bacillus spizizenii]MEC2335100.1 terminase family protein [Bacillus subtilis]